MEALRILRKELEKFRTERDQFKLMAETLQLRYAALRRNSFSDIGGFTSDTSECLPVTAKLVWPKFYMKAENNAQLAFDLKAVIDEKEELTTERDAYKCKAHRLNHELLVALRSKETHPK
ncbi:hypothetical protein EVAR_73071_1, partial [Eumeta japonica]